MAIDQNLLKLEIISHPIANEPDPQPDFFHFEPSYRRRMSSRALGPDTENMRDNIFATEIEEECFAIIKGKKNPENKELFSRSIVALALSSSPSHIILDGILAAGVHCLTMRPMGGMLHLVIFESLEDKEAMLASKWLDNWFIKIHEVNETCSPLWRETTMKIYGCPLAAWSYENFYNIGCIYGRVLSIEHSNFDHASVLVYTDCLFRINTSLFLDVEGQKFKIFTFEDGPSNGNLSDKDKKINQKSAPPETFPENFSDDADSNPESHCQTNLEKKAQSSPNHQPIIKTPVSPNNLETSAT